MTAQHRETEMAEIERPETGEMATGEMATGEMATGERVETPEVAEPESEAAPALEAAAEAEAAADDHDAEEDSAAEAEDDEAEAAEEEEAGDEADEDETEAVSAGQRDGADDDMEASDFDNLRLVEALLFASTEPLAPAQIARFLPDDCKLEPLLADLQTLYANRGVNLVKRGGRWAFRTAEDLAPRMELENKVVRKLSRVALETLAVIAYHQPVTRAEIEEIRGVALSKGTLDALLEIGWIRPKGRRKTPGRPVTWGTSDAFLDQFNLESLDALPGIEELKAAGLLDARPALTALSDRGMLPAAGEVAPEARDDEDEDTDGEIDERSERELLEETFGENLLPHEVDLAAAGGADEDTAAAQASGEAPDEESEAAPDEAENEMFGGADEEEGAEERAFEESDEDDDEEDVGALAEDAAEDLEDDLDDEDADGEDADEEDADEEDEDEEDEDGGEDDEDDDDLRHRRRHSAGRA